jgi:hypothetical protein
LGRLINRCLIAHPDGADTIELVIGHKVRFYRAMRATTSAGIAFRSVFHVLASASMRFVWALQKARDIDN